MWRANPIWIGILLSTGVFGQEWRPIGSRLTDAALADPASGPVARVWYEGDRPAVRLGSGAALVLESGWKARPVSGPEEDAVPVEWVRRLPEPGSRVVRNPFRPFEWFALGADLYRSEDGGRGWTNLTSTGKESILGGRVLSVGFRPDQAGTILAGTADGVGQSLDGGVSWAGLNADLPNLPVRRVVDFHQRDRSVTVELSGGRWARWQPGERELWRIVPSAAALQGDNPGWVAAAQRDLRVRIARQAGSGVLTEDGRLFLRSEGGGWVAADLGRVESIFAPDSRQLLAVVSEPRQRARVVQTTTGGRSWDDLTGNLPEGGVFGITGDPESGAVYVAARDGLFQARMDYSVPGPAPEWTRFGQTLPEGAVRDVYLDGERNQLFVAVEGFGLYAAIAPHRSARMKLVSAADLRSRTLAPGALMSVLGGRVRSAQASGREVPVLQASDGESQVQLPYDLPPSGPIAIHADTGTLVTNGAIQSTAPAIFLSGDGTPLLIDGDSGEFLDARNPARAGTRVQILASGLGRVRPDWAPGLPAPAEAPPEVVAPVQVLLDRRALKVDRAVLAPGFAGVYLVEFTMPEALNRGVAELAITGDGRLSNATRIFVEP
jgi:uncharacterized protein (TIGR03437 family)